MADTSMDFDAVLAAKAEEQGKGPSFRLRGKKWQCLPAAPAHALRDLVDQTNSIAGTFEYLQNLLVKDQREAFSEEVLEADDIDVDFLTKIVEFVTESYSGRPTEPASSSD
jgi:hypothetical protein